MKDQYFGDINDYRKYGLLRALTEVLPLRLGVCWLRTCNDKRRDGELRRYLANPERWRHYDPELYDRLQGVFTVGAERSVLHAETWGLLPGARYYHNVLNADTAARRSYLDSAWHHLRDAELIFLDPDNGLEVQSVAYGKSKSLKYVYWREVEDAYTRGHSLVIYQHFPRQKRDPFVARLTDALRQRLAASHIESFRTAHVAFFTALRPEHSKAFQGARELVMRRWKGEIF